MRKVLTFLLLTFIVSSAGAGYNGLPQVGCRNCTSSDQATAQFARDQTDWLGWNKAGAWYVYDTVRNQRRLIKMYMVYPDGSTIHGLSYFGAILRTLQGAAPPNTLRINVYNTNGGLLYSKDYLLSSLFANYWAPTELPESSYLSDYGDAPANINTYVSYSYSRIGSTREAYFTIDECYGECQLYGF